MKKVFPIKFTKLFIDGAYVDSQQGNTFETINPSTEEVITKVSEAQGPDVELAVKAARKAFDHGPWRSYSGSKRCEILLKLADLIVANLEELAYLEAIDNGKPYTWAYDDVKESAKVLRYYAGYSDKIHGTTIPIDGPYLAYVRKEPVGVCAQIIPWNFPFMMFIWKIAPALATGCTIVIKPAELTPLTALFSGHLFNEAGIPAGVINVIAGYGPSCGTPLIQHPLVDKVAFTGSTAIGYHIMKNCHEYNLKRVSLELGGKSANIVLKDGDIDFAVNQSIKSAFCCSGQNCIAPGRIYVQEEVYDEFCKKAVEQAKNRVVGEPFDEKSENGPQISQKQMEKILALIQKGADEGAKILLGGKRHGNKGYFVEPTVIGEVTEAMTIAKEEIFGPVLVILKFKTIEEAIERANSSKYGLGGGIFTRNMENALKVTNALRAGTVYVNCYDVCGASTPFGGYKDSGIGRELGEYGLQSYLELKTVIIKIADDALP